MFLIDRFFVLVRNINFHLKVGKSESGKKLSAINPKFKKISK